MYNKLFGKIVNSSIWLESDHTRIVWMTLLATMDEDGFCQFASVRNLAHTALVPIDGAEKAVAKLEAPDPESSDPEHEGRRIERVPGGWYVLNAPKYRAIATKEHQKEVNRKKSKKWRDKQSNALPAVTTATPTVTKPTPSVSPSEAEAEAEAEGEADANALPYLALAHKVIENTHLPTRSPGLLEAVAGAIKFCVDVEQYTRQGAIDFLTKQVDQETNRGKPPNRFWFDERKWMKETKPADNLGYVPRKPQRDLDED